MSIEKEQKRTNLMNKLLIAGLVVLTGATIVWMLHVGKMIIKGLTC